MMQQQTLRKEYIFEGKGLHTGKVARIRIKPAPVDYGIRFVRTDIGEDAEVRALAENVSCTARSTTITEGDVTMTTMLILWLSAIASAFVDNIPFVATLIPMIKEMGAMGMTNLEPLWWALSLGACLGGNGTLIGASANVVVAGMASQHGHKISFVGYMKIAFPLMILSIIISSVYIYFRYL